MDRRRVRKAAMPYGMRWATRDGKQYLHEALDRKGNTRSLGPRSDETERAYDDYAAEKADVAERLRQGGDALAETCRLYRAARLPTFASKAAAILREADRRSLLGSHVSVVGTNAMPAYVLEAGGGIEATDRAGRLDLMWMALATDADVMWPMLQAVDPTYMASMERPFQARSASAYEVEILVAFAQAGTFDEGYSPRIPVPEQGWLSRGTPVSHTVVGTDGSPARLVVLDPRYFALQKLWMAGQDKRDPLKRPLDTKQGMALLDAVQEAIPPVRKGAPFQATYPVDAAKQGPDRMRPSWSTIWKPSGGICSRTRTEAHNALASPTASSALIALVHVLSTTIIPSALGSRMSHSTINIALSPNVRLVTKYRWHVDPRVSIEEQRIREDAPCDLPSGQL